MSAIVLTKTPNKIFFSEKGFLHQSLLLYAVVLTFALIFPSLILLIPGAQKWVYFPAVFIFGSLCFFGLSRFYQKKIKKEVLLLTRSVKRFTKGDFSSPLPSWKNDAADVLTGTIAQGFQKLHEKIDSSEQDKAKLSMMLEYMSEGVVGVNRDLRIIICNPSAKKILGYHRNPINRSLIELTHHPDIDSLMTEIIENQTSVSKEIEITYPEKKHLKISAASTGAAKGICGVLVLHDITEIKKLENLRKDFVANVSHELRTPLTSIIGFLEILQSGAISNPEQSEKFIRMMQDDAKRLHRLIEDLLAISSLESGETRLNLRALDVKPAIEKVLESLEPQITKKEISLVFKIPGQLPAVSADHDRFRQVLLNLLDNAVKFTPPKGRVTVHARLSDRMVEVGIEDSGPGIPEEALHRVFERFFRADKARSREEGGTGLGLSIVKHIVEAHGGTVSCKNAAGGGAFFRFTLPSL